MAGITNFPTALDTDVSLYDVTDAVSDVLAAHHNNMKEALKVIEAKLGIYNTDAPTSLDFRLGNPTGSHKHDGASGMGIQINPSDIDIPSGGFPSGYSLRERMLMEPGQWVNVQKEGSLASGAVVGMAYMPRTTQLIEARGVLRVPASGATTGIDVRFGPTSAWLTATSRKMQFNPGATLSVASIGGLSLVTVPSGAVVYAQVMHVGSNTPGQDLSITFVFRESGPGA
jgi:hypothetical protein